MYTNFLKQQNLTVARMRNLLSVYIPGIIPTYTGGRSRLGNGLWATGWVRFSWIPIQNAHFARREAGSGPRRESFLKL